MRSFARAFSWLPPLAVLALLALGLSASGCPGPVLLPEGIDAAQEGNLPEPDVDREGTDGAEPALEQTPDAAEPVPESSPESSPESRPEFVPEPRPSLLTAAQQQAIDAAARKQVQDQGLVGLAIGIVYKGKLAYTKGYGWADKEKQIPVVGHQTMFRWASISKTLAGVIAMKLVNGNKLDLTKPIQTYYRNYAMPNQFVEKCTSGIKLYKEKPYSCIGGFFTMPLEGKERNITAGMLLGHLAGIPHYTNGKDNPSPPIGETDDPNVNKGMAWAVEKYLMNKPLIAVPGDKYSYSTFGFNLLGVVLERAAGSAFEKLVQTYVATPAGLRTLQPDVEWKDIPHRAKGYYRLSTTPLPQGSSDVSWKLAGGGYISTVEDLALYCRGLSDKTLLTDPEKKLAWTRQKPKTGTSSYGMGFVIGSRNGKRTVSHSGSQQKARTYLRLFPDEKLCITVMTNSTYANPSTITAAVEDAFRQVP